MPQCNAIPTWSSTPSLLRVTPDIAATATAYCKSFQSQFPLTPYPTSTPWDCQWIYW